MSVQILTGDCRVLLPTLPAESVHCVVTSPPYFGLRDYGTGAWEGGDPACGHVVGEIRTGLGMAALSEQYRGGGKKVAEPKPMLAKDVCPHCGARRVDRQIGLELTPDAFVAEMVAVFREVRRVLRSDGTLWLNLGDSYCSTPPGTKRPGASEKSTLAGIKSERYRQTLDAGTGTKRDTSRLPGLKPKDLIGIPWRVALALQADGWWLRQDIIWHKPNPMPESVEDRCTKAHEYLFLLTKSERYRFDFEAIAELSCKGADGSRFDTGKTADHQQGRAQTGERKQAARAREIANARGLTPAHIAAIRAVGITDVGKAQVTQDGHGKNDPAVIALAAEAKAALGGYYREFLIRETRNKRSVWTVATKPFAEAHFAAFPEDLVEPCILAGCPVGGTVLDPFGGAGTTGLVANRLGRDAILLELNPDYAAMAERRIAADRAGPVERAQIRHGHKPADWSNTLFAGDAA